jgi:hypothetical protein
MSMEMSPESSPGTSSKRTRAKPKIVVKSSAAPAAAVPAKKPRAPRKTLTTKAAATETPVVAAAVEPSTEELDGMIATAAYYLASARNFMPGHELDDWLEAERSVRAQLWG